MDYWICASGVMLKMLYLYLTLAFLFGADFLFGKKIKLPSFRDCLKERGTVQMLTVGREAALEVQVCPHRVF